MRNHASLPNVTPSPSFRAPEMNLDYPDVVQSFTRTAMFDLAKKLQAARRVAVGEPRLVFGEGDTVTLEVDTMPLHDHTCPINCGPEHDAAMDRDAWRQIEEADGAL